MAFEKLGLNCTASVCTCTRICIILILCIWIRIITSQLNNFPNAIISIMRIIGCLNFIFLITGTLLPLYPGYLSNSSSRIWSTTISRGTSWLNTGRSHIVLLRPNNHGRLLKSRLKRSHNFLVIIGLLQAPKPVYTSSTCTCTYNLLFNLINFWCNTRVLNCSSGSIMS